MKFSAILSTLLLLVGVAQAQQPQSSTAPISAINAKYVNGTAPGYWPQAGSGLTLNLSAGTAFCAGTVVTYAGGALSMTANTTNRVYLNTSASCAPAVKTGAFTASDIPIAVVNTSGSVIAAISDVRSPFTTGGSGSGGTTTLTGAVTGSGTGSVSTTLAAVATPGTYVVGGQAITINAAGQTISIGTPFAATFNCAQCGTYETGYSGITSASGTISYTNPTTPTSASVSDGTITNTLSTPFTSWSITHTYLTNTTFVLTALGSGQTITPTQSISFAPYTFGGVGTAGATGANYGGSGGSENALLVGATGNLANGGFNNQATYGPYAPSGQKVYILMIGGSHTFTSGGFAFPMNTPTAVTFTNQYGGVVNMYLYESTNTLSATFTITVAS